MCTHLIHRFLAVLTAAAAVAADTRLRTLEAFPPPACWGGCCCCCCCCAFAICTSAGLEAAEVGTFTEITLLFFLRQMRKKISSCPNLIILK